MAGMSSTRRYGRLLLLFLAVALLSRITLYFFENLLKCFAIETVRMVCDKVNACTEIHTQQHFAASLSLSEMNTSFVYP